MEQRSDVTDPTCAACDRVMGPGVSCDPFAFRLKDGTLTPRSRVAGDDQCNGCGAPRYGYHHSSCDRDHCSHGRAASCDECELMV